MLSATPGRVVSHVTPFIAISCNCVWASRVVVPFSKPVLPCIHAPTTDRYPTSLKAAPARVAQEVYRRATTASFGRGHSSVVVERGFSRRRSRRKNQYSQVTPASPCNCMPGLLECSSPTGAAGIALKCDRLIAAGLESRTLPSDAASEPLIKPEP
jgi:hypothetical protein